MVCSVWLGKNEVRKTIFIRHGIEYRHGIKLDSNLFIITYIFHSYGKNVLCDTLADSYVINIPFLFSGYLAPLNLHIACVYIEFVNANQSK